MTVGRSVAQNEVLEEFVANFGEEQQCPLDCCYHAIPHVRCRRERAGVCCGPVVVRASAQKLRVVAWNVKQGGGTKAEAIATLLARLGADVAVLSEHKASPRHGLADMLRVGGFEHQAGEPDPLGGYAAVLVASRLPLEPGGVVYEHQLDGHRLVHVKIHAAGCDVLAAYIPGISKDKRRKQAFWRFILEEADPACRDTPTLFCGDLNTGLHYRDELGATFSCAEEMAELLRRGWRDGWIEHNRTLRPPGSWQNPSSGNPFRLDHALLSPVTPKTRRVEYLAEHEGIRLLGKGALSDHSALVVDLAAPPKA